VKTGILLVVVAVVLYAGALTLGLFTNQTREAPSADQSGRDWLVSLNGMTARFAPHVDLKRLRCNGQPVSRPFRLTHAAQLCELDVPGSADEDYRQTTLELLPGEGGAKPGVYIRAKYEQGRFPVEQRNPASCFLDGEELPHAFRLEVRLAAEDEDLNDPWECWLQHKAEDSVSLTVMQEGGRITLRCAGCDDDTRREIRARMK
jgi:hypothetical protein